MNNRLFSIDEINNIVNCCLYKLRRQDQHLLDMSVNERTITHKLAEYLQQHFSDFNVDCEYNRFEHEDFENMIKSLNLPRDNGNWDDTEAKTVFPDIIIHKRGRQENNILIIEVKKSSSNVPEIHDRNKLKAFTKYPYNYNLGLFLKIDLDNSNDHLDWYSNGLKIMVEE